MIGLVAYPDEAVEKLKDLNGRRGALPVFTPLNSN